MIPWVDKIRSVDGGWIDVQKRDLGIRIGTVDLSKPRTMVPHTTEGYTLPTDWARGAPTMAVGPTVKGGRPILQQLIPFGYMATALVNASGGIETNRWSLVQLEQVAITAREVWLPPKEQEIITASLAEFCENELGIDRRYPYDPKDMRVGMWAVADNPWRRSGKFGNVSGWHPHVAIPDGNVHWDCGGEDIPAILRQSATPNVITAFQVAAVTKNDGHRRVEQVGPFFAKKSALRTWMVRDSQVRREVWKQLRAGKRIYIAERRVDPSLVRSTRNS